MKQKYILNSDKFKQCHEKVIQIYSSKLMEPSVVQNKEYICSLNELLNQVIFH